MEQIDDALDLMGEIDQNMEDTEEVQAETTNLAEHRPLNLHCKHLGINQCQNLCNSYPPNEIVDCKATCYAKCFPTNSKVDPERESGKGLKGGRDAY